MGSGRLDGPCDFSVSTSSLATFLHRLDTLWISARAELEAFVGVMILIESDWARPWLSGVLASDASLYGAAQSFWNPSDVATVGRVPEVRRWVLCLPVAMHLKVLVFVSIHVAEKSP